MTNSQEKDKGFRKPYEPPKLLNLGGGVAYAQGVKCKPGGSPGGGVCQTGATATSSKCRSGGSAGLQCKAGTGAAGGACKPGGAAAGGCKPGTYPT